MRPRLTWKDIDTVIGQTIVAMGHKFVRDEFSEGVTYTVKFDDSLIGQISTSRTQTISLRPLTTGDAHLKFVSITNEIRARIGQGEELEAANAGETSSSWGTLRPPIPEPEGSKTMILFMDIATFSVDLLKFTGQYNVAEIYDWQWPAGKPPIDPPEEIKQGRGWNVVFKTSQGRENGALVWVHPIPYGYIHVIIPPGPPFASEFIRAVLAHYKSKEGMQPQSTPKQLQTEIKTKRKRRDAQCKTGFLLAVMERQKMNQTSAIRRYGGSAGLFKNYETDKDTRQYYRELIDMDETAFFKRVNKEKQGFEQRKNKKKAGK